MFVVCSILLRGFYISQPMAVAARSKAWVFGSYLGGIAGSNPAGGIDVCVLLGRILCDGPFLVEGIPDDDDDVCVCVSLGVIRCNVTLYTYND